MIAVDPASQRRGIGSALTDPALAEMRARGDPRRRGDGRRPRPAPARSTYERAGFIGVPQVRYAKRLG